MKGTEWSSVGYRFNTPPPTTGDKLADDEAEEGVFLRKKGKGEGSVVCAQGLSFDEREREREKPRDRGKRGRGKGNLELGKIPIPSKGTTPK